MFNFKKKKELKEIKQNHYCVSCKREKGDYDFYFKTYSPLYHLEKDKNIKLNICKDCATRHMDVYNSDTFLWVLEALDVPYVPYIWEKFIYLAEKAENSNEQKNFSRERIKSIFGKYINTLKLDSYLKYTYSDSYKFENEHFNSKRFEENQEKNECNLILPPSRVNTNCKNCGAPFKISDKYCEYCGTMRIGE